MGASLEPARADDGGANVKMNLAARHHRARKANRLICVIATTGRCLLRYRDRVARLEVSPRGRVFLVDYYTGRRIDTHRSGAWRGWTGGGTMKELMEAFRVFICTGKGLHPEAFGPHTADMWAYGLAMRTVRDTAKELGIT